MSVCEIGATIGKMWRELTDEQKQKYNEDFANEKVCTRFKMSNCIVVSGHLVNTGHPRYAKYAGGKPPSIKRGAGSQIKKKMGWGGGVHDKRKGGGGCL